MDEPIRVYRHALNWLAAGGDGVCVLDWTQAAPQLRPYILVAEDPCHGAQVERGLLRAEKPRVRVHIKERAT